MRLLLALIPISGVLAVVGFYLVPLVLANGPAVLGGLGVLFLITAAVIPRRKPKCRGLHCAGCPGHH